MFDVDQIATHGGSIRIYVRHDADESKPVSERVASLLRHEQEQGLDTLAYYRTFTEKAQKVRYDLLEFLIDAKRAGKRVVGYGAPGKGNTLLNYCGIRSDLLEFTVDRSTYKHGRYLPGTRIPIDEPSQIFEARPDYVLILPWNIKDEIMEQMSGIAEWGGRFVVAIPEMQILG